MLETEHAIVSTVQPSSRVRARDRRNGPAVSGTMGRMAKTKKRTTKAQAKPASGSNGYSTATSPGRIRSKARREQIEALIERTTKDKGLSPEVEAYLKDDAWGKRLIDP